MKKYTGLILGVMVAAITMQSVSADVDKNTLLEEIKTEAVQIKASFDLTAQEIAAVHKRVAAYKPQVENLIAKAAQMPLTQRIAAFQMLGEAYDPAREEAMTSLIEDKNFQLFVIEAGRIGFDCHEDCLKSDSTGSSCMKQMEMFASLVGFPKGNAGSEVEAALNAAKTTDESSAK